MGDQRSGATAVLLQDGMVLISGGSNSAGPVASADAFGTNGAFTPVAPMNSARSGHTATLLGDGRVLVTGGDTGIGVTNSAEVYDPTAGSWTFLGAAMLDARVGHTASLMPDGRVLLAGGHNSGGALSTLEIFDPLNDDFTSAGTLTAPRMNHAAAVLGDGRVMVIGGTPDGTNALATVEIYDPVTRTVGVGPSLSTPRMSATATTALDGKVAVIGGSNGSQDLASAEVFDPATGEIALSASTLATPRSGHKAFLLTNNNSILIVGGTSGGADLNSTETYFPWTDSFQTTGAMSVARPGMAGSAAGLDGRFLAAGGTILASTELYGFATVKTDKNDYAPGEVVTITGSGWQPGETVTLTMVESPLFDTHPPMTAVADGNGNIVNTQFSPDEHDMGIRFYVTAVGSQAQAQNTFTDAVTFTNITVGAQNPSAIHSGNSATYNPVTLTFSGNGSTGCTVTLSVTGLPAGASFVFGTNPLTSTGANTATTLSVNTTAVTPAGTFPLTVQGVAPNVSGGQGCNGATRTTSATLVVDNASPTVTINQAAGQPDPTKNPTINFTVLFSEPVADFATGDVTLGGTAGATTANVTGSGTAYSVAVSGMTTDGSVIASIAAGVAHDTAGNPNTASTSTDNTVTYDATAPAPPSTPDMTAGSDSGGSNTDKITSVKKPTFTGTEAENGTTITLLVDGVANGTSTTAGGNWSITAANNIADGDHTITATATDTVGNVSNPSGSISITIDSVANAPSTPDLDAASDSGSSNTDNNTNVTTPKFNGTAEKNATVELFRGGTTSLGTTTADASGNWSLTLATALADSPYSITAKQTDEAGNVSVASSALSITIDTAAPAAPSSPNLAAASDIGILNTDNITSVTTNLSFSGTAEANSTVTIFEGAVQVGSGSASNGGNWNNVTAAGPFGDGSHVFTAKATDAAGNPSLASAPHTVMIDTVRPSVTINQAAGQSDPAAAGPIHFTVVFNESISGFATGDVTLSGTAGATTATVTPVNSTTFDVSVTGMSQSGSVIATINQNVATDTAGNNNTVSTSTDNSVTYNPDSKAPVVTINFSVADGLNGWYKHSPVLGTVSANDTTAGNSNVTAITCTDGVNPLLVGGPSGIGTPTASGSLSVTGEGTHGISCQATDSAGNIGSFTGSTVMPLLVKIDTVAPMGVSGTAARLADHNNWYTSAVTINFSGTDTTSGIASCTSTPYGGPDSATASVLGHCTDNAGNASADVAFDFKYDATAPTGVALSVTAGTVGTNGWYTSDVTLHTAGTESVSTPLTCTTDQFQTVETAGQVFNASCTNDAGLTSNALPLTVKLDRTGPTAGLSIIAGTLGDNGWYVTDVTVHAAGTDSISNPVVCTADQFLTTDSPGHSFNGSCTNDAGLSTNAADLTVKRDATPPTIHITPDRGADHNGWYNHGLSFTNPGTDSTSGIESCSTPAGYSGPDSLTASVSATCKDFAGNTGNGSFSFQFDSTPPVSVTSAPNRTADHNGWYNHAVDISFSGTDGTSGIDTCTTTNYSGPDTTSASVVGHCSDKAGNTSSPDVSSTTFKFDSTPPTAVVAVTAGTPGSNGWYTSNVTVGTTGADTVSNPTTCTADQFQTAETTGTAFNGECTNDAGLSANATPFMVKLDKTAPTGVTLTATGTLGLSGWYTSDVSIKTSGTETISNPIICTVDQSQTTDTTGQTFHGSCANDAGLSANASDISIKRDATAPVLMLAFSPDSPDGNNGWWRTPAGVPFIWTCNDATSGVDGGYNGGCASPTGTVTTNGVTNFSRQVRDQAGNLSVIVNRDLKLDNVAPLTTFLSRTLANANGWNNTDVSLSWTCSDGTSGAVSASDTKTVTTEGVNQFATGNCQDNAGNTSSNTQNGVNIDKTPPTVTPVTPPAGAPYLLNQAVTPAFTCSDNLSGFVSSGATSTSGRNSTDCTGPATVNTSTVGPHSYGPMVATDKAGNTSVAMTTSYNINYNFVGFLQPIDNLPIINTANAGRTIPVKWQLKDANGVLISDLTSLTSLGAAPMACSAAPAAIVEEQLSSPGSTVFRFDGAQFIFNWQTTKSWSGCWLLQTTLNDGTVHYAKFQFK
jgi:hypothetical protein